LSNIHTLLHLFATLSVTAATNERSFLTYQRLLAYLRSTMGKNRPTCKNVLDIF